MKPIIIHSMGHCGTRSVRNSLERAGLNVYFGHDVRQPARFDEPRILEYAQNGADVFVIVPIRRPSYRNLSAFFGDPSNYPERTLQIFMRRYPHKKALDWFDAEFLPVWGVDVYEQPFDKRRGWKVYEGKILVIRLDVLSREWKKAYKALTGCAALQLEKHGSETLKKYLDMKAALPADYIAQMQDSKYYRHFFA